MRDPLKVSTLSSVLLLSACMTGVSITIENNSKNHISEVFVSGNGFDRSMGSLEPSDSKSITVRPKGDSSLLIRYSMLGHAKNCDPDIYITNNQKAKFKISINETHQCNLISYQFGFDSPVQLEEQGE